MIPLAASPPAVNTMILANAVGMFEQETANMLFYSYIAALFTMTSFSVIYLLLIQASLA